jgi:hypothetical protein
MLDDLTFYHVRIIGGREMNQEGARKCGDRLTKSNSYIKLYEWNQIVADGRSRERHQGEVEGGSKLSLGPHNGRR